MLTAIRRCYGILPAITKIVVKLFFPGFTSLPATLQILYLDRHPLTPKEPWDLGFGDSWIGCLKCQSYPSLSPLGPGDVFILPAHGEFGNGHPEAQEWRCCPQRSWGEVILQCCLWVYLLSIVCHGHMRVWWAFSLPSAHCGEICPHGF